MSHGRRMIEEMNSIYDHPRTYDLEHSGDQPDVAFFLSFASRHRPKRILEIACGDGRVTLPMARAATEWGGVVHGVDSSEEMIERARERPGAEQVSWVVGDIRREMAEGNFELIYSACSSLCHLQSAPEQLAAWRNVFESLSPGGHLVIAEAMANHALLADSMRVPPRQVIEFDGEFEKEGDKMVRRRSARYRADLQRLEVRFFYDRVTKSGAYENFENSYEAHVYFPNELRLLFHSAGFEIENEWGDYASAVFGHSSRVMILCGRRGT